MERLLKDGIIRNTKYGYVDNKGNVIGYHRTVHKMYIEDFYADYFAK